MGLTRGLLSWPACALPLLLCPRHALADSSCPLAFPSNFMALSFAQKCACSDVHACRLSTASMMH